MEANATWQVSGSAAERYEKYLVPVIFVPWAEELLSWGKMTGSSRLLDVACGTGVVARMAREEIEPSGRVVGVDINPDMLRVARAASKGSGIEWVQSDATKMPFEDKSFDIIICQQGLQFFPDKIAALKEFRRVLRKRGKVVASIAREMALNPLMLAQAKVLEKHFGPKVAGAIKAVCQLSDPTEIRDLFQAAGFEEVKVESVELTLGHPEARVFATGLVLATPAAEVISALPREKRTEIIQEILDEFGDCFDGKALSFPHVSHVVTARA